MSFYVILRRNGWVFASEGMEYVCLNPVGVVVKRDMHKLIVEQYFMDHSK